MSYHYWGHELEYHGAFPAPRLDEYLCRFCGLAVSGQAYRTGIAVPKCDPLKRIRALERELAEARACGSPCPECRSLAELDAAVRAELGDRCSKGAVTYRGHELEYLGRLTEPSPDEYRCRLCGFSIAGNVFRTSTRAWSEVWVPSCDPLKRIRALEKQLSEADLLRESCTKELPKALATRGHRWSGSGRCAFCNVDRETIESLSGFRLSPDAFATKENPPMRPIRQNALETLRRVLATSTEEQQAGLAALIEVEPDVIRRCAERCRAEVAKRHDVLGDMLSVLLQHGGSWNISSEVKLGARYLQVRWNNPAGEERRVTVARDASTHTLEQVCSEALGVIEHYTRPDGGLDL